MRGSADASLRVLVVDDNRDTALSLSLLFEAWGHEVRMAYDGPSAVEAAIDFQPGAILLDIGLPRLDGFGVAKRLRALPQFAQTLIIAASGYGSENDRRRASQAGIDVYLVKPFDPFQLEHILAFKSAESEVMSA